MLYQSECQKDFSLCSFLSLDRVMFLTKNSKEEILQDLTNLASSAGVLGNKDVLQIQLGWSYIALNALLPEYESS